MIGGGAEMSELSNREKYDNIFKENFSLRADQLGESVVYSQTNGWDSIGHMSMVAACEETFGIALDTEDIINFSSYTKGFEILEKYGVHF
jgi:acyl carrier protein